MHAEEKNFFQCLCQFPSINSGYTEESGCIEKIEKQNPSEELCLLQREDLTDPKQSK